LIRFAFGQCPGEQINKAGLAGAKKPLPFLLDVCRARISNTAPHMASAHFAGAKAPPYKEEVQGLRELLQAWPYWRSA